MIKRFTNVNLPQGSALDWDMSTLTLEQLEYEEILSHEALYGHYDSEGKFLLRGLLDPSCEKEFNQDTLSDAIRIWKLRLKRAQDELFERNMLI